MSDSTTPHTDRDLSRLSGRSRTRSKNPAASAKILATGLSATAMLGMTAGYALAARETTPVPTADEPQGIASASTVAGGLARTGGSPALAPLAPLVPGTSATSPQSSPQSTVGPQSQAPVVAQLQIVEIPVETIAPATPGNGGGGWNNQPSSGSN